jgi:hypothetical protein
MTVQPIEHVPGVESSFDRFREHSFFVDECLDLLTAIREDPHQLEGFERAGHRRAWLEDIIHQLEVLEKMTGVLLNWETVKRDRPG